MVLPLKQFTRENRLQEVMYLAVCVTRVQDGCAMDEIAKSRHKEQIAQPHISLK